MKKYWKYWILQDCPFCGRTHKHKTLNTVANYDGPCYETGNMTMGWAEDKTDIKNRIAFCSNKYCKHNFPGNNYPSLLICPTCKSSKNTIYHGHYGCTAFGCKKCNDTWWNSV